MCFIFPWESWILNSKTGGASGGKNDLFLLIIHEFVIHYLQTLWIDHMVPVWLFAFSSTGVGKNNCWFWERNAYKTHFTFLAIWKFQKDVIQKTCFSRRRLAFKFPTTNCGEFFFIHHSLQIYEQTLYLETKLENHVCEECLILYHSHPTFATSPHSKLIEVKGGVLPGVPKEEGHLPESSCD